MASKMEQMAAEMDPNLFRNGVWGARREQESTILIFFLILDPFWEAFGARLAQKAVKNTSKNTPGKTMADKYGISCQTVPKMTPKCIHNVIRNACRIKTCHFSVFLESIE